jgi:hypothetical protein
MTDTGMPRADHIIEAAIERAKDNLAAYFAAVALGITGEERDQWIDILYRDLYRSTTPEDRVRAIAILIGTEAQLRAQLLTRGVNAGDLL